MKNAGYLNRQVNSGRRISADRALFLASSVRMPANFYNFGRR
jgi:hypothetical protein